MRKEKSFIVRDFYRDASPMGAPLSQQFTTREGAERWLETNRFYHEWGCWEICELID